MEDREITTSETWAKVLVVTGAAAIWGTVLYAFSISSLRALGWF
jgi:hypothetical protein